MDEPERYEEPDGSGRILSVVRRSAVLSVALIAAGVVALLTWWRMLTSD
jgi:hypothetical protein